MKKKLILFDWGNIVESHLTGYTCYDAFNDLFYACGYTGEKEAFNLLEKYNISLISNLDDFEKTYELISKEFGFNKSFIEFIKLYKDIFDKIDYYEEVAQYEVSLKDKCYIGILSNLDIFDKERLDKEVNLSLYDYVFLSYEMGLVKPNIELYEMVQSQLSFNPEDILFIDDKKDNIEMASKVGWNVLQANGLELDKIKKRCEEFIKDY